MVSLLTLSAPFLSQCLRMLQHYGQSEEEQTTRQQHIISVVINGDGLGNCYRAEASPFPVPRSITLSFLFLRGLELPLSLAESSLSFLSSFTSYSLLLWFLLHRQFVLRQPSLSFYLNKTAFHSALGVQ